MKKPKSKTKRRASLFDLAKRPCAYKLCAKIFKPYSAKQKYHSLKCRVDAGNYKRAELFRAWQESRQQGAA